MSNVYIFDIEADGLYDDATKIHCLAYQKYGESEISVLYAYEEMLNFFSTVVNNKDTLVGHNIVTYDIPLISKLLKPTFKFDTDYLIDTLLLSQYLYPNRKHHGLESWGKTVGIKKPLIVDWINLTQEEYGHRCSEDVKINFKIFKIFWGYLNELYKDKEEAKRLLRYLSFKFKCVLYQELRPLQLDLDFLETNLKLLTNLKKEKKAELESILPPVAKFKDKVIKDCFILDVDARPTKYLTRDMDSVLFDSFIEQGYTPAKTKIKVFDKWEAPNGNSVTQIKDFLFSKGWKPSWYKNTVRSNGEPNKVPQISSETEEGELCESVKALFNDYPELAALEGLGRLSHRISLLKGLKKNCDDNNKIKASALGITNTLRLRHTSIVNLPGKGKEHWDVVRGVFIADKGNILCGCDLSQLEDNTKRHYIYPFDPEYVEEQLKPGFDAHLDVALLAGMLTEEQIHEHKEGIKKYDIIRHAAKQVNFSGIYGIGATKLSSALRSSVAFAKNLLDTYWKRNHSVKVFTNTLEVKVVRKQKWLFNPVSGLYYSLRAEKDKFSTCNQSTGVWVFDTFIKCLMEEGIYPQLQMHDEVLFNLKEKDTDKIKEKLKIAMKKTNEILSLNVPIKYEAKFGYRYSEVH